MFNDVIFAEWSWIVVIIAFAASVGIFVFFLIGALRTPQEKLQHDAAMPLQDEKLS